MSNTMIVDTQHHGQRLDNFLLGKVRSLARSNIYKLIRSGQVRCNKSRCKPMQRVATGDIIRLPPWLEQHIPMQPSFERSSWVIDAIVYEDEACIVVNKPAGIPVHGGSGHQFGLINLVRTVWNNEYELVHRIDKDTSGCLLISKNRAALLALQQQLKHRAVYKQYNCVVAGDWPDDLREIDIPLTKQFISGQTLSISQPMGKQSLTRFTKQKTVHDPELGIVSVLHAFPITGRNHQIRSHCASAQHPVIGDSVYSNTPASRLHLHAETIGFKPIGKAATIEVSVPIHWSLLSTTPTA